MSIISKLDIIAGHQQVVAVSFVVEPQAGHDLAARQIVFDVHERVTVTAVCSLLVGRFETERANPSEDQGTAAHRLDKSKNFVGLT